MRSALIIIVSGAGAALAHADGAGVWLWTVTTDDGDAIVEPGETATATLSMAMLPDQGYEVVGINAVMFDTLGGANAAKGSIVDWEILNSLADLTGDLTTTDGVSLYGTVAGQIITGPFTEDNPVDVLTFNWAPDVVNSAYTVDYSTFTEYLYVWEGGTGQSVQWPLPAEAHLSFSVVPAPGAVSLLLPGLITMRRRRMT